MVAILWYCTNMVDFKKPYSFKSVGGVTNNVDIIRQCTERASFWCEFHHHLHCQGDMAD